MIIHDEYTIECLKSHLPAEFQPQLVVPCELDPAQLIATAAQLSEDMALAIADCLKIGVEHTADADPDLAFELADTIIQIGQAHENGSIIGLGMMAQGDIMTQLGRNLEAWDKLEQAGEIYKRAGDEIGWARTRINRLSIGPELHQTYVDKALIEAAKAEEIFLRTGRYDRLLRLYHSWAFSYDLMGRYEEAIAQYQKAVQAVEKAADAHTSQIIVARLHSDMGNAYNALGELQVAMNYLTQAREVLLQAHLDVMAAMTEFAMAKNYAVRGQYRQALHLLLNSVLVHLKGHRADAAKLTVIDCYLALNRNREAYILAQEIVQVSQGDPNRQHQTALSALFLAMAQTRMGYLAEANHSLDLAATNFRTYETMEAVIQLRRGQIALRQGDVATAQAVATTTAERFQKWHQSVNWLDALLLQAEAAMKSNELKTAQALAQKALCHAREQGLSPACYRAYVMLGQICENQGRKYSSIRLYRAALVVLRQIQHSLTLSLRTGFLEDKLLPFRRLMHLYLTDGRILEAFHTLEHLKSQVFWDYLSQRELLHWVENTQTRPMLEELRRLRDKYRWFVQLQSSPPTAEAEANPWYRELNAYASLQHAIADCEKQMRQLTEQLYLFSPEGAVSESQLPELETIQSQLDADSILIEFYADRERMWVMTITHSSAAAYPLSASTTEVQKLIETRWRSNLEFALQAGPHDERTRVLTERAQSIGEKLYQILLQPIIEEMRDKKRLVIVPYGFLHQLSFNMLRTNHHYLIEDYEIVALPSASLLSRSPQRREGGAAVVANSWDGRLTYSIDEGRMVHHMFGGTLYAERDAQQKILRQPPRKVLHISTHGQHRIDQPDFACIELNDGPVYTDDLLQYDLSYELVVLSACEVGRANVTAGDELIGLGRGFLYAGAGALITSLWRVNEQHTFQLMQSLYRALCQGDTKAAALRTAQQELLSHDPHLHPAFWAAFQLICNADPLITI